MTDYNFRPDEMDFYIKRQEARRRRTTPRCYGLSSDALAAYALRMQPAPGDGSWHYPADRADLAACELTYEMAPSHLQERMLPLLEKYRAYVEKRYPSAVKS